MAIEEFVSFPFKRIRPWCNYFPRMRSICCRWLISCPGEHADDVLDGFLAALGVHSVVLPLLGGQGFEQREVGFAERAKLLD